jgi:hypothetical protein
MIKVRVLGPPDEGFALGGPRGDVHGGDLIELEEHEARLFLQQGRVELVIDESPAPRR